MVFTNKRMIAVDVKEITSKKQYFSSMPYKMVLYFNVQTVGFMEPIPDAELDIHFSNSHTAHFEFRGRCKIIEIVKMISKYCLNVDYYHVSRCS